VKRKERRRRRILIPKSNNNSKKQSKKEKKRGKKDVFLCFCVFSPTSSPPLVPWRIPLLMTKGNSDLLSIDISLQRV